MCYLSFCWAYAAFIANGVFGLFFYFYHRYKIKKNNWGQTLISTLLSNSTAPTAVSCKPRKRPWKARPAQQSAALRAPAPFFT